MTTMTSTTNMAIHLAVSDADAAWERALAAEAARLLGGSATS